ncbi:MAG: UDP-3-O-(3-hydroxymyristoyl)glucosamine N-acyltransferase [Candidatus Omnitrophica bacterium]|nr:UDP-3-O-(3-hydroxymyristoyl)glucosamine N-acyltransferase [Candidatus Omnitrophota bacterium]
MQKTLREIAQIIGGEIVGDADTIVYGVNGIKEARSGEITFIANPKYLPLLEKTSASAVITGRQVESSSRPLIRTDNPSLAFTKVISLFEPNDIVHPTGIHPSALLGKGVSLGKGVAIGPYVVVGEGVSIGDRSVVYSGCFIGAFTRVGSDTLIYPSVTIRERIIIGNRVIVHSGTVIGSDGFGFINIEGSHQKIPQVGTVEIGDDVEIGANVAIDRARFDKTVIGTGTKIDNLVHIAHNVVIGKNSIIVAQVGISGSTTIGNGVTLAGQAGLVGHISIGDGAIVAAQGGVTKSVAPHTMVSGYPARLHEVAKKINACVQNLPRLYESVKELKEKLEQLEEGIKKAQKNG